MIKLNVFTISILLLLGFTGTLNAELYSNCKNVYTIESVPNPKVDAHGSYVSNPNSVLTENTVANIDYLCKNLEEYTGVQLAIVVLKNFCPINEGAYNFAINLFNYWKIGDARANNGILVLVATDSYDIQICTGRGIENILTDDVCGKILDDNIMYFNERKYNEGTMHIVSDICRFCQREENIDKLTDLYHINYVLWTGASLLLLIIVIIIWIYRRKSKN